MSAHRAARGIALAFALLLAGCAGKPVVLSGFEDRPSAINLTIVDSRPALEKTSERLSPWVTSCDYEIHRLGDETSVPSKLVLLRRDLEDALGEKLKSATVTVTHYRVFYNARKAMRGQVGGMYTGVVPAMMTAASDGCTKENTSGGWYDPSEVTTPNSPFIVEAEIQTDGKTYSARSVLSPAVNYIVSGNSPPEIFDACTEPTRRSRNSCASDSAK